MQQLTPVAQELSPTLQSLSRLAPPFRDFFVDLGPLITASYRGLPAFQKFLDDLRPALGQLDPFTRTLNPVLRYISDYLPEIDAFFGNFTVAANGLRGESNGYVRGIAPITPEVLATYPRRLAYNRGNPYRTPGTADQLLRGLASFETRQCTDGLRPIPNISDGSTLAAIDRRHQQTMRRDLIRTARLPRSPRTPPYTERPRPALPPPGQVPEIRRRLSARRRGSADETVTMRAALERVARAAAGHPLIVLLVAGALALGGGALALGLQPSTSTDSLASRSSAAGGATADFHRDFGDDAIFVLVREKVSQLVLTDDLGRVLQLEGCLSGNVPSGKEPYGGADSPCAKLAELKPARIVYGPGTFLNQAANTIQDAFYGEIRSASTRAARARADAIAAARRAGKSATEQQVAGRAAESRVQQDAIKKLQQLYLESGLKGMPSIDNRAFVSQIVFDPERGADQPAGRFAYLFPNADSALVQVRLRDDLSEQERTEAIELVRAATEMPMFRLRRGDGFTVSGVPVVVDGLAGTLTGELTLLLAAAVAAMALVLLLVFRARLRLLPLVLALAAAGLTFGLMRIAGVELTMASIAVLPVLIGLAVDYAIQFQSRVEEQRAAGERGAAAVGLAARAGAPTIATAALATATGFLVLLLSPVPMVRGFGLLLVVGIALAFVVTLTVGAAALALVHRGPRPAADGAAGAAGRRCWPARPRVARRRRRSAARPPPSPPRSSPPPPAPASC